ncbi:MAG: T9SS type A sorting domain-containing protein [Patiriisocius sp.]|uniref:T9SS type A sorting domain-containing protein n=1 Tax=Patiriisocius sp. TaxID=2822396 RepID=UPI003EF15764
MNTSENITLFPNPTQNFINIKSDNPIINLKVYSMEGILLIDKNSTRINISELSSGVYFVNVSVNGRIISKKFIKS